MGDNVNYAFVMHNVAHSKIMCKWIINLGAFKHMTLHKITFDTYEVIAQQNVHLNDDSVVKTNGMETIMKDNINNIHIKDVLNMSKLYVNLLSMSNLVSNNLKI